jgi:superfamily I DNA/RNA helicase
MSANTFSPTDSQRAAIEAPLGPALVLAGPGAGKTYCLIERIRFLIERVGVDPKRINAFTFTNKAAEEIGSRLDDLDAKAQLVKRGTIHAFCAELLRTHGHHEGLERGFGIADENYQRAVLSRLGQPARFHTSILGAFALHRLKDEPLRDDHARTYADYVKRLERRNMADFDMLIVKAAHLLETVPEVADEVRASFDHILVDEFQDLNQRQYEVVRALALGHRNVFAVGDDEQSIFSWTGADTALFAVFKNDFEIRSPITLRDNHRCPRQVFDLAKSLVRRNPPGPWTKEEITATRGTSHPVRALNFGDELVEGNWLLDDLQADRDANADLRWGDYAVLYRRHEIGDFLEASLIGAGIPCRLALGRAVGDDPVIAYVVAALKVIADPTDDVNQEEFLRVVLPPSLLDLLRTKVEQGGEGLRGIMETHARSLGKRDPNASKLWRALFALRNLESLGRKHDELIALVEELLSQRVGVYRTMLEDRYEELSDPEANDEAKALAARLRSALEAGAMVWVEPMGGIEIPMRALLQGIGFTRLGVGAACPDEAVAVRSSDTPSLGRALGLFKALQLVATRRGIAPFSDFTAVDIETTDKDVAKAEIIDLAAVRVRNGAVVAEWSSLVKPGVPIRAVVTGLTGITEADVADAPRFDDVWPAFREFCGSDVVVAHNGYSFDFPILERMSRGHGLLTYDTLVLARELRPGSRRLGDLAQFYGIEAGHAHRALDDSRTLAQVFLKLDGERIKRSRTTALANLLDQLGIAMALDTAGPSPGAAREFIELRSATAIYSLGRYSDALEQYRIQRELADDADLPTVDEVIERLGGKRLMDRLRLERSADDRYPQAMSRLRRLLASCDAPLVQGQIAQFLELVALSKHDGTEVNRDRVSLLTLHSTKGLEFSRVYVVGVEDSELPGGTQHKPAARKDIEEGRRLLYVGMTRAKERLVLTRAVKRGDLPTGGIQFLAEMGLKPESPGQAGDTTEKANGRRSESARKSAETA